MVKVGMITLGAEKSPRMFLAKDVFTAHLAPTHESS